MDAKQLVEAGKQILKAAESGDPPSTLLSLLKPLQDFTATDTLLRASKIGVAVNKLRQNKDPKVQDTASRLINKWKQDIKKGSGDAAKKPAVSSPAPATKREANGAGANGRADTASPAQGSASVKKEPTARKSSVAPEKRTADADGIKTGVTGNATRDGCLKLIYNGLAFMSEEAPDDILAAARSVELAAYNEYQPETSAEYKQKMRSLFMNLKMKENIQLRTDVFSGKIQPKKFVTMSSDELKSDEKRAEIRKLEKENMSNAMTAKEQKAISTTYVFRTPSRQFPLTSLARTCYPRGISTPYTHCP